MTEQLVQTFAYILSTITILSCLLLKVPQIMYIREKKSSKGISVQAMLMEIAAFTTVTLYNYTNNYNIMTYLEYPVILVQIYALLYYVLKYDGTLKSPIVLVGTLLYIGTIVGFTLNLMSKEILSFLVPFCTPLSSFAKVTYIYTIIKSGNAEAVALTTWIISALTNLSRLFTVYVDSSDGKLMFNFTVSTLMSSGVLFTAMYYQIRPRTKSPRRQREHLHDD